MTFAHILSADIKKLSKTSFFLIHLLVPIAVAVVFTIYTAITLYKTQALVIAYFQVIAIAFPVIAAIISSLVIDQEMDAGDGYYILSAPSRIKVLSSKLLIMICAGLFSSLLTGICFGTSLMVIRGASIVLLSQCMISSIIIWACTIFLYIFQTLL
ncbi:MAG: hypothetical protein LBN22_11100, partial [Clostridiales Family XIII bacterium]|nr:hypothetical protein [Clostridiales Family XIII bacterium]